MVQYMTANIVRAAVQERLHRRPVTRNGDWAAERRLTHGRNVYVRAYGSPNELKKKNGIIFFISIRYSWLQSHLEMQLMCSDSDITIEWIFPIILQLNSRILAMQFCRP